MQVLVDRVICILSSGNLSLTQATIALIDEDLHLGKADPAREQLTNRQTIYETINYVGSKVREVEKRHREALEADGFDFNIHLIVGGQIAGFAPEVHLIYPQGNSIHATRDCPFLQIGERKYGKPILDRSLHSDTPLAEAMKIGFLSFDAAIRSNLAVARPLDVMVMPAARGSKVHSERIAEDDAYFDQLSQRWEDLLAEGVASIDDPPFMARLG
jgi:putative proteasome-type protease